MAVESMAVLAESRKNLLRAFAIWLRRGVFPGCAIQNRLILFLVFAAAVGNVTTPQNRAANF